MLDRQAAMEGEAVLVRVELGPSCASLSAPLGCIQHLWEQLKTVLDRLPLAVFFVQAPWLYHRHLPQCPQVPQPFCLLCWCVMVEHDSVAALVEPEIEGHSTQPQPRHSLTWRY